MRIALIADIHGNLPALQKVLQSINENKINKIICLGDICEGGFQPAECLHLIRRYSDYCVIGNTDSFLLNARSDVTASNDTRIKTVLDSLNDYSFSYLSSLPLLAEIPLESGVVIKAFHGTMDSNNNTYQSIEMETMAAKETGQIFYIFGHTHQPFFTKYRSCSFINPGSVGKNRVKNEDGSKKTLPISSYCIIDTASYISVSFIQLDI
jgi:putative phosphoesterase